MATFTKAQIIAKIASDLPDNTTNLITPDDLRGVLLNLLDMIQGADFISYLNGELEGVTNVQGALDALVTLIDGGTLLTASQIRDLLQTLTGANRLSKAAIQGADFALNRRGKGDVTDTAGFQMGMGNRHKGDYWIFDDGVGGGGGGGGESETLENGDWLIALVNNATLHSTDSGYLDSEQWEVIKFGGESTLTKEEIAALLNDITTLANMVNSHRVKYSAEQTVQMKIDAMDAVIDTKGKTIHRHREIYEASEGLTWGIAQTHIADVIMLSINRVPYQGIEGSSFMGYDFRWVYDVGSGNTAIFLNPSIGVSFTLNDIIDLIYTKN